MRDDFDEMVADQFKLLDQLPVPDTWSRVRFKLDERPIESTDFIEPDMNFAHSEAQAPTGEGRTRHRWMLAAAAVLLVVGAGAVVLVERDPQDPAVMTTNTPVDTTSATVESSLAAAIESGGLLVSPSAEEIAAASDTNLYQTKQASTQVSAADQFVSLRECRSDSPCSTGWAYESGSLDGGSLHHGLLGDADAPAVYVLDDRFFVVMEISSHVRQPTTWLIDSQSGRYAELTWRDEPTTVSAREQALVISDGLWSAARFVDRSGPEGDKYALGEHPPLFLPRVVDARDGTIRPLAVPDTASADLQVAQNGQGRIWIGTTPGDNDLGLAYSDDGGATWTERSLPAQLLPNADETQNPDVPRDDDPVNADELRKSASYGDLLLSIAAEGDRIAVTDAWWYDGQNVYISSDSGLNWSTVTVANPSRNNGSHLYVLTDQRLLLVRSDDTMTRKLLVSAGADWTTLEADLQATEATRGVWVDVNRDGIASKYVMRPYDIEFPGQHQFSSDLTNWQTIELPDD